MKKVLLIGIWGVYNYGCEAIVRGTINQIKSIYPDAKITFATPNYLDDKLRLIDCDIDIIPLSFKKRYNWGYILKKIYSFLGKVYSYSCFSNLSDLIDGYDCIFSIGGDMYTLSPTSHFDTNISRIGDLCFKKSIDYYIWGCSIGPFSSNKVAEQYFKKHLSCVTKIVARENVSIDYLKSLGITSNVYFAPDPAYYVSDIKDLKHVSDIESIKCIGLNLSPHSAHYCYNNISEAIDKQVEVIKYISNKYSCKILLLPHVLTSVASDDDYSYLKAIKNKLLDYSNVELVENDPGFIGIKRYIRMCDIVLSSRMHCNINSIVEGVPSIFLGYSSKAQGMANYIYENDSLFCDITALSESKIDELFSRTIGLNIKLKNKVDNFNLHNVL